MTQPNISIQLYDSKSNLFDVSNITKYDPEKLFDCQIVIKVETFQIAKFYVSIDDLYEKFASKYYPNIPTQRFTFLNSNGTIGIYKRNNILEFEVSRYGGESYGEICVSIPIDKQIDELIVLVKQIYDFKQNS